MVRKVIVALCICVAASAAYSDSRCTKGSEFEPPLCPLSLPDIERIFIAENGATSPADSASTAACSRFVLTEPNVRRYLSRARQARQADVHYTLDWSPCYATGTIVFRNGKTAHWHLTQSRVGYLTVDGGEEITMYCPTCQFKPFQ